MVSLITGLIALSTALHIRKKIKVSVKIKINCQ